MWKKDGKVLEEVLYPKEQSLKSRVFKVNRPQDGGVYSCHLVSMLRDVKQYNITGNITITGKQVLLVLFYYSINMVKPRFIFVRDHTRI